MSGRANPCRLVCVSAFCAAGIIWADRALAQQPAPVSKGVYRLPYTDGTDVRFSNDHTNHPATLNRVDMTGQGAGPHTVVAAAAGVIQLIVENNDTFCPNRFGNANDVNGDGTTTAAENQQAQTAACTGYGGPSAFCCERNFEANGGTCPGAGTCLNAPNNFVWIEHANGEWTKYTHMQRGSIGPGPDNNGNPGAGRFVGEPVTAGTPLGLEGDVGIAGGPHVHFEVGVPEFVDTGAGNPPATVANWFVNGFLVNDTVVDDVDGDGTDDVNRQNRVPVFCQLGFASAGDVNTAGDCDDLCASNTSQLAGTVQAGSVFYRQVTSTMGNGANTFDVRANAGASIRAGTRIRLRPGFRARTNASFSASIGACDSPGGT